VNFFPSDRDMKRVNVVILDLNSLLLVFAFTTPELRSSHDRRRCAVTDTSLQRENSTSTEGTARRWRLSASLLLLADWPRSRAASICWLRLSRVPTQLVHPLNGTATSG
jgi:hypothetical protein